MAIFPVGLIDWREVEDDRKRKGEPESEFCLASIAPLTEIE